MKLHLSACAVLLSFACNSQVHSVEKWPVLVNGKPSSECNAAMRLADRAQKSDNFSLWEPPIVPADFGSTLVVGPSDLDLSGGDALQVDARVFSKVPLADNATRSVYWQTEVVKGERLVVEEMPHGWRGDAYAVRSIRKELSPADYFAVQSHLRNKRLSTIISGAWRAPLIFKNHGDEELWVIDVGQPYDFSPNWRVYVAGPNSTRPILACEIQFRPEVRDAALLLPPTIQQLSALLNESIGSGQDEGTLQPTARIRNKLQQAWANAALRPWAKNQAYNTRDEVVANLEKWSRQGSAQQRAYRSIKAEYPFAERALIEYYKQNFHMSGSEAKSTATAVLDGVFRSHYVFPK